MDSQALPPQDSGTSAAPGAPPIGGAVTADAPPRQPPTNGASNGIGHGVGNGVGSGVGSGADRGGANGVGAGGTNGHRATGGRPPQPARVRLLLQYPLVPATSKLPGIARPPIRQVVGPTEVRPATAAPAEVTGGAAPRDGGTATGADGAGLGADDRSIGTTATVIDLRDRPAGAADGDGAPTAPAARRHPSEVGDDAAGNGGAADAITIPRIVPLDVLEGRTPAVGDDRVLPLPSPVLHTRADEEERERPASVTRTGLEWLAIVAAALLAALIIKLLLFQAFVIPSLSMEPTLDVRDRVLVNKLSYRLHDIARGDVIVFERPPAAIRADDDSDLIKRVIGLPGETIEARGGRVLIDGEPLTEPWLASEVRTADFGPVSVPPGQLFVLGDNRSNSADSRFIGTIDEDLVIGKAFVRWWPPGRAGGL